MQSGQNFEGVPTPMPPQTEGVQSREDLARLGAALKTRTEEILSLTVARTSVPGHVVEALVQDSFERICNSSTSAVAGLIAGDDLEVARTAGQETWQIFGELAARGAAPERIRARNPRRRAHPGVEHAPDGARVQPRAHV